MAIAILDVGIRVREFRPFEDARAYVRKFKLRARYEWADYCSGKIAGLEEKPDDILTAPARTYEKDWIDWGDWLGTERKKYGNVQFRDFVGARAFARSLGLQNQAEWRSYCKRGIWIAAKAK